MNTSRQTRSKIAPALVGLSAAVAGVFMVAIQVERGVGETVMSDPGSFTAPATNTMTTGATTSTSPGQPSVSASVATPQITTTPTSAEPGSQLSRRGRFRVATTRDTGRPSRETGAVTSPHGEPRLADVVELPLARVTQGDPAAGDEEREPETIILLW